MLFFKSKPKINIKPKMTTMRLIKVLIGFLMYAAAFNLFFLPNNIVVGGISGIAIIISYFIGINPALSILIMALVSLTIGFILLSKKQTMTYLYGYLLLPLFIYLTSPLAQLDFLKSADLFIIVIYGGLTLGVGSGLIIKNGFSNGEIDIISSILSKYLKSNVYYMSFIIGGFIVALGGFISENGLYDFNRIMYAIVALYISSTIAEKVIIGISSNKTFYIFTDELDAVKDYIIKGFKTSITIMKATGGYFNQRENIIMCVISTKDYFKIKEGLKLIDKDAFFIATDAYETTQTKIRGD